MEPPTFELSNVKDWKAFLDSEGYVVISDILTEKEKKEAFRLFQKDWKTVSPNFNFDDPDTYKIENTPMIYGKGMAVFNGFGQSDFMWYLREQKSIQSIFKQIHNTDQIVTSMDGFSVYVSGDQKTKSWLHIDQNPEDTTESYQGSYNLLPVNETSAGFVVVPKSHITYKPQVTHKKNWITVDTLYESSVKLLIPENCFTIWNSRVVHCNTGMTEKNKKELNRITAYISMFPKSIREEKVLEEKKKAYRNGQTTTHWANKCVLTKYPYGFKTRYLERGFGEIKPKLVNGEIPVERLNLI